MVSGLPVVIATNGRGLAVTEAARGVPCEIASNGFGLPIVVKLSGGLPIVFVGSAPPVIPNLMEPFAWTQGVSTTMTIAGGRVRATYNGTNPRVYKRVTGLTFGATYRVLGRCYPGVGTLNYFFRVSPDSAIPNGSSVSVTNDINIMDINQTFVCPATIMFIGVVGLRGVGEYVEIDEDFALQAL